MTICIEFDLIYYLEPKKFDNLKYNTRAANIDLIKQAVSNVDWTAILGPHYSVGPLDHDQLGIIFSYISDL